MTAAVRLENITVAYDRHPAVHHVGGTFEVGSLTAVTGPNGAGKSTLLKAIMGEIKPVSGAIDLCGLTRTDIGYLPQAAAIDLSFPLTVADTVLLGGWSQIGAFGKATQPIMEKARAALKAVGLGGFEDRPIGALSAGQAQRVLFARLLLQDAKLIVLDEPFTAIDARTTQDLLQIVQDWHREGRTIIAVLHDFEQVRSHFPKTLLLARELVAWGATKTVLSRKNLGIARAMTEAWDGGAVVCTPGQNRS